MKIKELDPFLTVVKRWNRCCGLLDGYTGSNESPLNPYVNFFSHIIFSFADKGFYEFLPTLCL